MTNREKLDQLERSLSSAPDMEVLRMLSREIIKTSRAIEFDHQAELAAARQITQKLQEFLREALRQWLIRTPDVEAAVAAWRMAQEAGLT